MKLKPCPFCGSEPIDKSYDRRMVFKCIICNYSRTFPGYLQTVPDNDNQEGGIKPVNNNNDIDEYYHYKAKEKAIEKWNIRQEIEKDLQDE